MLAVLFGLDWRLGLGMLVYRRRGRSLLVSVRHRAVSESSDEMGAYARLYGGIEERLTAAEDLRCQRRRGPRHVALRRGQRGDAAQLGAPRAGVPADVVGGAERGRRRLGPRRSIASAALVSRRLISLGTAFLLFQYVQLHVPAAGGPGRPAGDGAEGQRGDGACRRPAGASSRRSSTAAPPVAAARRAQRRVPRRRRSTTATTHDRSLHDIDLEIAAGRSVGVVGRTGSGKTTFSRLLLRLVEPTSGTVRLGGVAIADIPLAELRRRVALCPRRSSCSRARSATTSRCSTTAPTDDAVVARCAAPASTSLADGGIDRPLGAGGAGLSAGEAQLLALARVWLRHPDLVVLDEATARVDPATEERLEAAVAQLIVRPHHVRHRPPAVDARHVDEIMVFDHGRVVEHGDRELLWPTPRQPVPPPARAGPGRHRLRRRRRVDEA